MAASKDAVLGAARELLHFIHKSPSPFHVVEECRQRLVAAGFKELTESDHWDIKPLDKCFVTRNQSMLIAFAVGGAFRPGSGFSIIGAHTDSPCLKVKPISRRVKQGYIQVGVECYGGGTWHSWLDRDLKLAGRVLVKNADKIEHRLVNVDRPILRVPNIAIHLQRDMNEKLQLNKENHLTPVLATVIQEKLDTGAETSTNEEKDGTKQVEKHHSVLMKLLSEELGVSVDNILDFELFLADHVPPTLGGMFQEFIFAPRLDNLHSSFCGLQGLLASCGGKSLEKDTNIRMLSLFDNEETGSVSAQGAQSTIQELIMRRLSSSGPVFSFEQCIPKSVMVSADMAHAIHPNYVDKHEEQHRPDLHKGPVLKFNANQRYATTSITATIIREIAKKADVPIQDFVVRNDMGCGSTIGPAMSAKLGIPAVDLGAAQLSMHSIREMCSASSVKQSLDLFQGIYEHYPSVYNSMSGF